MRKLLYLFFLLFINQYIIAQVPSYVPTNGLVAYYPFDGNANDESGNGNDGVVNGATLTTDRFGNVNSAYEFDGIFNSITVSNQFFDNGYGSYVINFWLSINDINQTMQCIYNTIPHYGEGIAFNHENSLDNISHWKNSNTSVGSWDIFSSNPFEYSPFLNSTTYMITVVKSETTYSYYVNGFLDKTTEVSQSAENQFTGMIFGLNANGNEPFNGIIDDIGIWNRALTEQEVADLYASGVLSNNPVTYSSTVNIYPNPAIDQITIDCGNLDNVDGWSIKITNMLGQEVFNEPIDTQQYVIPLNAWSGQGVYFVKIINAQNKLLNIKKVILQ